MDYQKIKRYNYILNEIGAIYHEAAVRMEISDSVQNIYYVLCENGGSCLQSEIYKQTGVSRQTINSAVRKLEREGEIYLKQGEGRNTIVCLTKQGEKRANEIALPILSAENEIFEEWTKEELDTYFALTERYRDALQKKLEKYNDF